ncbi:NACHT, LRR and PYD domains-containing protein 12 isoform X5 [Lates calcarifer]|uniref:NACHT, LRR and PYD domains-containing protein 12 isoform X5 n=1 Tax=Lates calcarifer TaxID=8187 RepID=A0AAJ8B5Q1_LATCA|nr:NACHT, LRR and PYD domains-containing protein 12 isoform X5 [Lates calcarifer]
MDFLSSLSVQAWGSFAQMSEKKCEDGAQKRKKQEEYEKDSSPSRKNPKITNYFRPVTREVRTTENFTAEEEAERESRPSTSTRTPTYTAVTQRETGNRTVSAQSGGIVNTPQLTDVDVKGNLTVSVNNTYVHSAPRTDETDVNSKTKERTIQKCQADLKSYLLNQTKNLFQGTRENGSSTPLKDTYTELYITKGSSGEVNNEHEVTELECKRSTREEKKIHLNNIFEPLPKEKIRPQRVLTNGIAGIGKTVAVQKFTHDWAEGTANQNIQFVFPFTFRDLNSMKDECFSLMDLIGNYFKEVKDLETSDYDNCSFLFIFDGLDESQFPLDKSQMCRCVTKTTTVDTLLTNLIKGTLLHKALVWITSRPAAASKIPPEFINRVTEVRGFNDEQKEEYFQKAIGYEIVAQRIFSHLRLKLLRSLYIMCHIPLFCWISATVLQSLLTDTPENELPKTLTEMYTHFLIIETKRKQQKDYEKGETDKDLIMKLGKLAFEQLKKRNMIFDENDLKGCEIDLKQAAVHSGVCTQIIRKEYGLHRQECYSFIHLSVQEFLAALYVLETFIDSRKNLLHIQTRVKVASEKGEIPIIPLHKSAVEVALVSKYGQWDLFLRFLFGLSQDKNQKLLQKIFGFEERRLQSNQEIIKYIHSEIKKLPNSYQSINLFHCLNELGDQTLVEQVQTYQSSGDVSKISPAHWSALAFVLLVSGENLDVFDLKKYHKSNEVLERLVPVLKAAKKAVLSDCNLSDECCWHISSVLSLKSSGLEELDLSGNKLQDSGVQLLSEGLKSSNCKLQRLRLISCDLSDESCQALSSVLSSQSSTLKELDLSNNDLKDSGLELISPGLESPHCTLETLRLSGCQVTVKGCSSLVSALRSNPSHLKELDLSYNHPGDSGVKLLSAGLENTQCGLKTLRLSGCQVTEEGCSSLASALRSNPSHLKELDLSYNHPGDLGVKLLSAKLKDQQCGLETLRLIGCNLSERSCEALASVLSSQSSTLIEVDLSNNNLQDSGVKLICRELKSRHCTLRTLRLSGCQVTVKGCSSLASALRSNPSHLKELDLSYNHPGDLGVKLLSALKEDPQCGLETLRLEHGGEQRLKPGVRKYSCELELDTNTVNTDLVLSDNNRKVTSAMGKLKYPEHPDRFDRWPQLLCRTGLTGRCYWEVEWRGRVDIAVTYRGIKRKGKLSDCRFGETHQSWSLSCSDELSHFYDDVRHNSDFSVSHNKEKTQLPPFFTPPSIPSFSPFSFNRVGVYVDCPVGRLSFYRVSSDSLIHLHTFKTTFTEPLYPGFWVGPFSTLSLHSLWREQIFHVF